MNLTVIKPHIVNLKKYIPEITTLFIVISFFIYLGIKKDIWFCDEVYTYVSANACNLPVVFNNSEWISGADVTNYLAAGGNEDGSFHSISSCLFTDHVPLYFWIFRVFSLLFRGSTTKWIGLTWNLVLFVILFFSLKKFYGQSPGLKKLFDANQCNSNTSVILIYGAILLIMLHPVVLSEATTIRMYLQFTIFLVVYLNILDISMLSVKKYIQLVIITTMGLLTHFYVWIWIGLFSIIYILYILFCQKGKIIKLIYFSTGMLFALGGATLLFPYWIKNILFAQDTKGNQSLKKITAFQELPGALNSALKTISGYLLTMKINYYIIVIITFLLIVIYLYTRKYNYKVLSAIISSLLYSVFVVWTQPSAEGRYLWPICILLLISFVEILLVDLQYINQQIYSKLPNFHFIKNFFLSKSAIVIIYFILFMNILASCDFENIIYLRNRPVEEYHAIKNMSTAPWLIFENGIRWQFFCSLYDFQIPQLIKCTNTDTPGSYDSIIDSASEMVVYTDENTKDINACVQFINDSCNKINCKYEKIGTSTYMSVYRIYWE